jgi:hypothetical protein
LDARSGAFCHQQGRTIAIGVSRERSLRPLNTSDTREEFQMSIVQFTRFKSDDAEEMVKTAKQAKTILEKHGAEFLRLS